MNSEFFDIFDIIAQPCLIINQGLIVFLNKSFKAEFKVEHIESLESLFDKQLGNSRFVLKNKKIAKLNFKDFKDFKIVTFEITESDLDLMHNQRLKNLGTIAGGVAHDFNNILAGILGHTSYLKSMLKREVNANESLTAIEDVCKKAVYLTRELVSFSRQKVSDEKQKISLNNKIKMVCNLFRPAVVGNIKFDYYLSEEEVFIETIPGKMVQVLINLLINAKDACEDKDSEIKVTLNVKNPNLCEIVVSDTGKGIPENALNNVFDPFYTFGKKTGTGFGLSLVKTIVESLNGEVNLASKQDVGTRVSILLPCSISQKQELKVSEKIENGTEKILVVDDEDSVRSVVGMSLKHLGYSVTMVDSGRAALGELERDPGYDLILLDMLMPKMSGEQVFDKVKVLYPEIKVLIMSGFTSEASVNKILSEGGKGFLPKPFTIQQLSTAIRKCF